MNREYVIRWCIKAENDLKAAERLLEDENPLTDIICFHCQQAIEKYLKAFLTFHEIEVKRTHDIELLLDFCVNQDKDFLNLIDKEKASELTSFGVEVRYPDEFYLPTIEEALENFNIVLKVRDFIFRKLNIKDSDLKKITL